MANLFGLAFKDIFSAEYHIRQVVQPTPMVRSRRLSKKCGGETFFKLENLLQPVGSFKLRGAYNKIASLSDAEKERGIVAVSAGNHAQAVAFCAQMFGIEATIFMPETTPEVKVENTQIYGAKVVLKGANYDQSKEHAHEFQSITGKAFIHPFCDPKIISGQGTVALEILRQDPDIDTLLVPVGGGGLIIGCAMAAKHINPNIRVIGIQPEVSAPWAHSLKAGRRTPVDTQRSLADALIGTIISDEFFEFFRHWVDDVVTVSEETIAESIYWMLKNHRMVIEGGGAVGIGALLKEKVDVAGRRTAVVITGCGLDNSALLDVVHRFEHA